MSSAMEDVVDGVDGTDEGQEICVSVHAGPSNTIQVNVPAKATVFCLATRVSQAMVIPGDVPSLSFQGSDLEPDATLNELGITNGSELTARIKTRPVVIAPGPGLACPEGAESAAMSCVDSLALDADAMPAGGASPASFGEGGVTNALRELIKQLVSAKTAPAQVQDLMQICEDVQRMELENKELTHQIGQMKDALRDEHELHEKLTRNHAKLMRIANLSDGDADMWPSHHARGYPGADEPMLGIQQLQAAYLLGAMRTQPQAPQEEEDNGRSFLMKKGDADISEAHRQAQLPRTVVGSVTGSSGVLSSGHHMTKEEMDAQRRAHMEQMQCQQSQKQREQQQAEEKSRSREALFNTPFAGASKMLGKH